MSNNVLTIRSKEISYKVTKKKGLKYVRMSFVSEKEIEIIAPHRVSDKYINNVLNEKKSWIERSIMKYENAIRVKTDEPACLTKAKAQEIIRELVEYYAKKYGVEYRNIYIKKFKSRWGCCSAKMDLSFNYKLVLLPQEIINYVVVHEICHLIEFNHSHRFWNLVRLEVNNYKTIRQKLKYSIFN